MSDHLIITIVREFGAEGHEIGMLLSKKLGIKLYDKDLVQKAAENRGISQGSITDIDETATNKFLSPYSKFGLAMNTLSDDLFRAEQQIIHELAEKETCIIVGRLSDYILREEKNCMKVFIYAPVEYRVNRMIEKYNISEQASKKLVKKMDTARNYFCSYYSNNKWKPFLEKDLIINREFFSVEDSVKILETAAKARMGAN